MEIPSQILLIRLSSIGDILLTFPAIQALQHNHPETAIDFVIAREYQDVLTPVRHLLRNIIIYDKTKTGSETRRIRRIIREKRYPLIVDLHNNLRTRQLTLLQKGTVHRFQKHQLRRFCFVKWRWNVFNYPPVWRRYLSTIPLNLSDAAFHITEYKHKPAVISRLEADIPTPAEKRPVILIYPGARHFTKRWLPDYYQKLITLILEHTDYTIILGGSQAEAADNQRLAAIAPHRITDTSGKYTLSENFTLVSLCDLLISNDSAPMHIAALLGKPQIAIFGNTVRQFGFYPENPHAKIMEDNSVICRPCSHIGFEKCPKGHFNCMRNITPEQVFETLRHLLVGIVN
ncbi:MAG TPA: glycosyltransferase family 9 protein [Candidatus Marinimicrobia bacterium]|nr:glycosyltransferase family 9 protein [Candidatus Neomarinimicrobiota bacterium]